MKQSYIVEALLMDYDTGHMTYQPISGLIPSHHAAKKRSFFEHFDHPTARVVPVMAT